MLTSAQITAGAARLSAGKLTATDVNQIASVLGMDTFFGGFVTQYGYKFREGLEAFDDNAHPGQIAAQIAACLIKLEELGFGVAERRGGPTGTYYKEKDEYWQYVQLIFLKMYEMPWEMTRKMRQHSQTVFVSRPEVQGFGLSEREMRRRRW